MIFLLKRLLKDRKKESNFKKKKKWGVHTSAVDQNIQLKVESVFLLLIGELVTGYSWVIHKGLTILNLNKRNNFFYKTISSWFLINCIIMQLKSSNKIRVWMENLEWIREFTLNILKWIKCAHLRSLNTTKKPWWFLIFNLFIYANKVFSLSGNKIYYL